jgi:hypothetical protein
VFDQCCMTVSRFVYKQILIFYLRHVNGFLKGGGEVGGLERGR